MVQPNLFQIMVPETLSPFSEPLLAMEGISYENGIPNLVESEIGCFKGDCYCCPEDGSGNPIAYINWHNGVFTYYTQRSELSSLRYSGGGFNGVPGQLIRQESGDISGEINTTSNESWSFSGFDSIPAYYYQVAASNDCGFTSVEDYCVWLLCYGNMIIDCERGQIRVRKSFNFLDGKFTDGPEVTDTYYTLGNVPDVYDERDNKCGTKCRVELTPPCLFTKNSMVLEYKDFNDIIWERHTDYSGNYNGSIYYEREELTNLTLFNRTFVLPLYIQDCNISRQGISYDVPLKTPIGNGIWKVYGTSSYKNQYTGVVYLASDSTTTYNVEYFLSGITPMMKITNWHNVSNNYYYEYGLPTETFEESGTCTGAFNEPNCGTSEIYWRNYRYEDENDDQYRNFLPQFCEKATIIRHIRYDGIVSRGYLKRYYANL